jgi:hypothetical protein
MRVEGGLFSSHIRILETGTTAMRPDGGGEGRAASMGIFLKDEKPLAITTNKRQLMGVNTSSRLLIGTRLRPRVGY